MYLEDTGADATINAPFSVVDQYYRNLSGLAGGYQQALQQGLEYAGPCTIVARIHGNFMSGRRLGNDTHPVRQNGTIGSYASRSIYAEETFDLFVL
jgi:hypothetical protein